MAEQNGTVLSLGDATATLARRSAGRSPVTSMAAVLMPSPQPRLRPLEANGKVSALGEPPTRSR